MRPLSDDAALLDLFRAEAETQAATLSEGLLALEQDPANPPLLEALMRAAHSLKGAARIVGRDAAVRLSHAMEDCFVAAQQGRVRLGPGHVDALLHAVDVLRQIAAADAADPVRAAAADQCVALIRACTNGPGPEPPSPVQRPCTIPEAAAPTEPDVRTADAALRIGASHLDRLLALSGEALVASRWTATCAAELLRLKRLQAAAVRKAEHVRALVEENSRDPVIPAEIAALQRALAHCEQAAALRFADFDAFDRRFTGFAHRLQAEVLDCRMRPFGDGVRALPRMVRDIARSLGKQVRVEIRGETTPVDRLLLERLDTPLGHLIRNAIDHGIEAPAERQAAGKAPAGTVRLEARSSGGKLLVMVADDGRGIDPEQLRTEIVRRRLATAAVAADLSTAELFEFLFLPSFTLKRTVTDISGRGVGLDVVQTMTRQVGGAVRVTSRPGGGSEFQLQLPLTLSVVRAITVEIAGEPYAFPLARIAGVLQVPIDAVESVEGRQHASFRGDNVGLVSARQVLGLDAPPQSTEALSVIVLGEKSSRYGLVVDRLCGEGELVTRPLDPRLARVKDIMAAALLPDGSPVLVIDVEDMLRSIEQLVSGGSLTRCSRAGAEPASASRKRVLVVDDSLTVRELERKLLIGAGYDVTVAVDGMEAWNAVRSAEFDLVLTDVDMPRIDGIELVSLIRRDARLHSLPVMIVSYKDRDEDRRRGLEAGADYYLPKAGFHDDALLGAVRDLIGAAV